MRRDGCRSDPATTGGRQGRNDLAEGLRWALSCEEEVCLDDRLSSSVLGKGLLLSDESL